MIIFGSNLPVIFLAWCLTSLTVSTYDYSAQYSFFQPFGRSRIVVRLAGRSRIQYFISLCYRIQIRRIYIRQPSTFEGFESSFKEFCIGQFHFIKSQSAETRFDLPNFAFFSLRQNSFPKCSVLLYKIHQTKFCQMTIHLIQKSYSLLKPNLTCQILLWQIPFHRFSDRRILLNFDLPNAV